MSAQESVQQSAQVEQILETAIARNAERIMLLLQNKPYPRMRYSRPWGTAQSASA